MNQSEENCAPTFEPPPPIEVEPIEPGRSSKKVLFGVFGCGGCAVGGVAILLLGGLLLVWLGIGIFADQVKADLQDNPVVIEHLGLLEDLEVDLGGSMAAPGSEEFVFRATGAMGRGEITAVCVTRDADTEEVVSGTLRMADGQVYDLFPSQDLPFEAPTG